MTICTCTIDEQWTVPSEWCPKHGTPNGYLTPTLKGNLLRPPVDVPSKVDRIAAEIQAGTYDADGAKLGIAADRLVDAVLDDAMAQHIHEPVTHMSEEQADALQGQCETDA